MSTENDNILLLLNLAVSADEKLDAVNEEVLEKMNEIKDLKEHIKSLQIFLSDQKTVLDKLTESKLIALNERNLFIKEIKNRMLNPMSINLTFDNFTYSETVTTTMTVSELKLRVSSKIKMDVKDFLLKVNNTLMKEEQLVVSLLFTDFVLTNNTNVLNIRINDLTYDFVMDIPNSEEKIHLKANSNSSILDLKIIISENIKINLKTWKMKISDNILKDIMLLTNCIEVKTIQVIANEEFDVHVINDKRNYKVSTKRDTTITEFKLAVSEKIGLPVDTFYMTFNGQSIENVRHRKFSLKSGLFFKNLFRSNISITKPVVNVVGEQMVLESFEINKNAIIHVIMRTRGG